MSGFLPDKSGLCKFCKSLLEFKIGGISFVQWEFVRGKSTLFSIYKIISLYNLNVEAMMILLSLPQVLIFQISVELV